MSLYAGKSARTEILLLILAVTPLLLGARPDASATLSGVRVGVTEGRTRLVFEFSRLGFRHEIAARDDTSLTIRCRSAQLAQTLDREMAGEGRLRAARFETISAAELAIHLSLREPSVARAFRLGPDSGRPPRLVVDLEATSTPVVAQTEVARPQAVAPVKAAGPKAIAPISEEAGASPRPPSGKRTAGDPSGGDPTAEPPERREEDAKATRSDDPAPTPARPGPRVVVIDPGHGGHDPGATAKGIQEKEVCLDVARRVVGILNRTPGYRAHLTRTEDRFVPLAERMRFAERHDADLFVSIHVNAAKNRRASGSEVFFLSIGAATDRASRELARLENEADPDYVVAEDEELRGLPFAVDLRQSDTMLRSSRIAEVVLDLLSARRLAEPRGVKQAGFAVLKSFQVPSILVELGFISSQSDRKKLQTKAHRGKLAEALAAGVREYFEKYAPLRAASETRDGMPGDRVRP